MRKSTIIGALVLMGISLLGMVGLQLYWIADAVRVKQEQFDRSVHEALARVVEKLETQEAVTAVASGMATLQQGQSAENATTDADWQQTSPAPGQTTGQSAAANSESVSQTGIAKHQPAAETQTHTGIATPRAATEKRTTPKTGIAQQLTPTKENRSQPGIAPQKNEPAKGSSAHSGIATQQYAASQSRSVAGIAERKPAEENPAKTGIAASKDGAGKGGSTLSGIARQQTENQSRTGYTYTIAPGGTVTLKPGGAVQTDHGATEQRGKWTLYSSPLDSLLHYEHRNMLRVFGMPPIPAGQAAMLHRLQAQADSMAAQALRMNSIASLRLQRMAEKAATQQLQGRSIRFSVDTLQYIALHLDSLRRSGQLYPSINPATISAINVQQDSVFVFKNKTGRHPEVRELKGSTGSRVIFRSVETPQEPLYPDPRPTARITVRPAAKELIKQQAQATKPAERNTEAKKKTDAAAMQTEQARVEARQERLNTVVEKMVVEYVTKELPLEQRLNLTEIKPLLQTELQERGIALDFGYWVLAADQDTVAANHLPTEGEKNFATYQASLFPNDIFDKPEHLAVYFPDSQAYALKSLWSMLLLSGLFTLIMVATFGTTVHIIFRQKKLSDMKNDFINNMTHEFKTPIATISLAADAMANPKVYARPEKIQYYSGIIQQENKRMNAQVENVLQIARLEKNDYQMTLAPTDLHTLVSKAIGSIRLQVEERLGSITTALHATNPTLALDEVHFYNVICNLLDNANKYSPNQPDIRIETRDAAGGVLLAVEDKGMGMSRDTQLRVFDKFYRVPTGNLHNVKGFGLGLSYVKAIVKAHNGHIGLQSEPGRGSRFEVFIPATT